MVGSLRNLVGGLFDYAGLFPPAQLQMPVAAQEYLRLLNSKDEWIVSRFVCPVDRLDEFWSLVGDQFSENRPCAITVLGKTLSDLSEEHDEILSFIEKTGERATVLGYEIKVDDKLTDGMIRRLCEVDVENVYVELPNDDHLTEHLHQLAETEILCAKLRTGGATPEAYPTTATLAGFLRECVSLEQPFKLTAGLHHPLRKSPEHGFINVLAGVALLLDQELSATETAAVLDSTNANDFKFTNESLEWRGEECSEDSIFEARALMHAIGSCSIQEPLDDLQSLGWR